MTGADDAHGNVLLRPYIHSVHGKKCVYVHSTVSFLSFIRRDTCSEMLAERSFDRSLSRVHPV